MMIRTHTYITQDSTKYLAQLQEYLEILIMMQIIWMNGLYAFISVWLKI